MQDFLTALSTVSRGSTQDKLQWIFELYDVNHDGIISKEEMEDVVTAIYEMLGRSITPQVDETTPKQHVEKVFHVGFLVLAIQSVLFEVMNSHSKMLKRNSC